MSAGFAWGAAAPPPSSLPCTTDCGPSIHPDNQCTFDSDCPHSDPCLVGDCHSGHCHHVPLCYDFNDCTVDTCDANGACTFTPDDTLFCDDGVACTADVCSNGLCIGTPDDTLPCDDAVACTIDACVGGVCISTPDDIACDDGLRCTDDHCIVGTGCTHGPVICNDGNFCTLGDYCDPDAFCRPGPDSPCSGSTPVCDGYPNDRCVECTDEFPCTDPNRPFCDNTAGVCFECFDKFDCADPLPACDATGTCVACVANSDCTTLPNLVCDTANNTCVWCILNSDCNDGDPCTDQACSGNNCVTTNIAGCCHNDAECTACGNICDVTGNTCIFIPADSDGDGVDDCADWCVNTPGCSGNHGCFCAQGDTLCCDVNDPNKLCCDPIDPTSWCPCSP